MESSTWKKELLQSLHVVASLVYCTEHMLIYIWSNCMQRKFVMHKTRKSSPPWQPTNGVTGFISGMLLIALFMMAMVLHVCHDCMVPIKFSDYSLNLSATIQRLSALVLSVSSNAPPDYLILVHDMMWLEICTTHFWRRAKVSTWQQGCHGHLCGRNGVKGDEAQHAFWKSHTEHICTIQSTIREVSFRRVKGWLQTLLVSPIKQGMSIWINSSPIKTMPSYHYCHCETCTPERYKRRPPLLSRIRGNTI